MARLRPASCIAAVAGLLLAAPAMAQFGTIFSDSPPRPPANVPDAGPPPYYEDRPPPPYYPRDGARRRPPPVYQDDSDDLSDDQGVPPRQRGQSRDDVPPAEPLPAPMSLPPSSRPGGGTIQSEPLPPPPGTVPAAPPLQGAAPPVTPQPGAPATRGDSGVARTTPQTLPGLPPGIRQPPGTPQPQPSAPAPPGAAPQGGDEVVVEPPPQRIANSTAVFTGLDKITGRTTSFDVAINETVQFGALQVTPRVCYSRPPTESPNTDAFVEVDEVTLQGEIKRIFTGWMFKASPGLHAVDHPIYDVWLTDCKGGEPPNVAEAAEETGASSAKPAAQKPAAKPPARTPRRVAPAQPRAQQQPPGTLPALR